MCVCVRETWQVYLPLLLFPNVDANEAQHRSVSPPRPSPSFGPTLRLFFVDLNISLFLRFQRMRRTASSCCVCLLNSEMAITIIVIITMIILMNFHVAAAI